MSHHFHISLPLPSALTHTLPLPHRSSTLKPTATSTHHPHIDTPHPITTTLSYLDHIPAFSKHHNEYTVQHSFTSAKREARRSTIDTQIPELINEDDYLEEGPFSIRQKRTAEEVAADQAEWEAIRRAREAATRRNTVMVADMTGETKMEIVVAVSRVDTAVVDNEEMTDGSEGNITPSRE